MKRAERPDWITAFPDLAQLDADARDTLLRFARRVELPAGFAPFRQGGRCESYLFVVEGSVRVELVSPGGREIVLYRVETGQTCILTTACLLAERIYPADAVAETALDGVLLPQPAFGDLMARSDAFRRFVFAAYGDRLADLLALISEITFGRIDRRIARFLLDRRDGAGLISASHGDVATELGTVREVVSRQLKDFERRGWVALERRRIRVVDAAGLGPIAEPD